MMKKSVLIVCVAVIVAAWGSAALAVDIVTVPVGNPGNAADSTGYGAVNYQYNIGKYEVTAGQYREFLNAVGKTSADTYGLYNSSMNSFQGGCQITWNTAASTYDFSGGAAEAPGSTAAEWQDRPVNYVSWYDAAMFANWSTSGNIHQGAYDTSAGANWGSQTAGDYTGITAHDSAPMDVLISTYGRVYVIPTEDEWYKAAYYGGSGSTYYDYPTGTNSVPSNDLVEPTDPGNNATFHISKHDYTIGSPYVRTEVGAHENSDSPYGTFDQGGNIWEWNEAIRNWSYRCARGGSAYDGSTNQLRASSIISGDPTSEDYTMGFRVSEVYEPAAPGDTNGDGIVDESDYDNFIAQFGGPPGADSADFNGNGRVDLADFVTMRENFVAGIGSAPEFEATTPEPATMGMLALAGLAMIRRRYRR